MYWVQKWISASITNHSNLSSWVKAPSTTWQCSIPLPGLNDETVPATRNFLYRGTRCVCNVFLTTQLIFGRYSILPVLSLDGILHVDVLNHMIDGANFLSFIKGLLEHMQPWPLPNSVLVMDNAMIHWVNGVWEMVKAHGLHLVYLPAYSLDLNPIEGPSPPLRLGYVQTGTMYLVRLRETMWTHTGWSGRWSTVLHQRMLYGWFQHCEYIA